jgi:hypothetical protein
MDTGCSCNKVIKGLQANLFMCEATGFMVRFIHYSIALASAGRKLYETYESFNNPLSRFISILQLAAIIATSN